MAEARVFVDDAVTGRLPDVCAKTGVPAHGRLRIVEEIGRSSRLGILWLFVFLGPLGWIVLAFLAVGARGEELEVEIPYSDAAYHDLVVARRVRWGALAGTPVGGAVLLIGAALLDLGTTSMLMAVMLVFAGVIGIIVAEWRLGRRSVGVRLDASRRWVTLTGVHPAFAAACAEHTPQRIAI